MMGKKKIHKYLDPRTLIVKTHINGVEISNTLIDLVVAINIMSKQTMNQLKHSNLQYTPTLLQLADRSVIVTILRNDEPHDYLILTLSFTYFSFP